LAKNSVTYFMDGPKGGLDCSVHAVVLCLVNAESRDCQEKHLGFLDGGWFPMMLVIFFIHFKLL